MDTKNGAKMNQTTTNMEKTVLNLQPMDVLMILVVVHRDHSSAKLTTGKRMSVISKNVFFYF